MKAKLNNPYGYKICSKIGKLPYEERFLTYTYKQAVYAKKVFLTYGITSKKHKPQWHIFPITKAEVKQGIWRQVPFDCS